MNNSEIFDINIVDIFSSKVSEKTEMNIIHNQEKNIIKEMNHPHSFADYEFTVDIFTHQGNGFVAQTFTENFFENYKPYVSLSIPFSNDV